MAASEVEVLEEKLKSLRSQLQTECGILERMVYKNKNQHRRCSYFQYLLKVRRDLKLLKSADFGEVLSSCFQVISNGKARHKVHLLESLKRRKVETGKYTFMERLLGIARLLSQMVEPMLKAATDQNISVQFEELVKTEKNRASLSLPEISVLLAQSFFMSFSLTMLALLARIRVLVQQILLDVVLVFNTVSSLSQTKQSVKLTEGRVKIFREVFPTKEEFVVLECVWKTDKFVLTERMQSSSNNANNDLDVEEVTLSKASSSIRYLTIKSFLGDDETPSKEAKEIDATERGINLTEDSKEPNEDHEEHDYPRIEGPPIKEASQSSLVSSSSPHPNSSKPKSASREVAFLAVKAPVTSTLNSAGIHSEESESKKEDLFFSLLAAGSTKQSLL